MSAGSIALLVAWLVLLIALLVALVAIAGSVDTVPLQLATDAEGAQEALSGLDLDEVRTAIQLDYLTPFLYVPLGIIWIRYARKRFYIIPAARELGSSLYFILVVAGVADLLENSLLLALLSGLDEFTATQQWEVIWASAFAVIKFIGITLAIAYVLPATIWTVWAWVSRVLPWQVSVQELPRPRRAGRG
jgi:hypothetical protein